MVKPSSIGDVLHTFPAVALLRASVPAVHKVSWVVNENLQGVASLCPGVDRFVPFPRANITSPKAISCFLKNLRNESYDIALDFQGLLRSGLITKFSKAPIKVGFDNAREGAWLFYNKKVKISNLHSHAVDKNLQLVQEAFNLSTRDFPRQTLNLTQEGINEADLLLPDSSGNPTLAVCFSSRWDSKNWSPAFIVQTLNETAKAVPGLRCWLLGSKDDASLGDIIAGESDIARPVNLAGKTSFMGLAALLSKSQALFTVDSGPMHLAAALNIPCVAMFGATDPILTGPYGGEGFHAVITSKCKLSPCLCRTCKLNKDCSEGILPADAAALISSKLLAHVKNTESK